MSAVRRKALTGKEVKLRTICAKEGRISCDEEETGTRDLMRILGKTQVSGESNEAKRRLGERFHKPSNDIPT